MILSYQQHTWRASCMHYPGLTYSAIASRLESPVVDHYVATRSIERLTHYTSATAKVNTAVVGLRFGYTTRSTERLNHDPSVTAKVKTAVIRLGSATRTIERLSHDTSGTAKVKYRIVPSSTANERTIRHCQYSDDDDQQQECGLYSFTAPGTDS